MSAQAHKGGLNPAQWSALRYFAGGLSHAPTSASFADYEGISRASANQTVRSMIDKGLLARSKIEGERRALKVTLTRKGESLLAEDPIQEVAALVEALSDEEQATLSRALYRLAISMKA